jgi:hypothetical protein
VVVAYISKTNIEEGKNYIIANDIIPNTILTDSLSEFCIDKGYFSSDYYIKSKGNIYYCGYGSYWSVSISKNGIKLVQDEPILDECTKIK